MTEKTIKILGVQFAANPDYKFGDPETPEMWMRTINLLTELRDRKPRVVLKAEPTNAQDEKAVMARAMGRKIGYVNRDQRDEVRQLLRLSKRGMLGAEVGEVIVGNHGYLYITLQCEETATTDWQEAGFNWQGWKTDIPLVLPTEELNAEEEAAFVLEEDLLPRLNEVDIEELQEYLNIWMEGSRHDMSQETCRQRQQYIRQLAESDSSEVRMMAQELEHQGACMCNRHRMEERVMEWWPQLVDSDVAESMWIRWRDYTNGQLWGGLRLIDEKLRQLPGNLYESIGHMETVFSQLYYLNIPRETLNSILALLVLRVKTCHELGIEMRPMIESEFGSDKVVEECDETFTESSIYLNKTKGQKIDLIRVLNAMFEMGCFKGKDGAKLTKKDFFTEMGCILHIDLSDYDKDLSRSMSDSTKLDKHLKVFEDMKQKMIEIWNSR